MIMYIVKIVTAVVLGILVILALDSCWEETPPPCVSPVQCELPEEFLNQ